MQALARSLDFQGAVQDPYSSQSYATAPELVGKLPFWEPPKSYLIALPHC